MMRRWHSKIDERRRRYHALYPHSRPALDIMGQAADRVSVEEPFRIIVPEAAHWL